MSGWVIADVIILPFSEVFISFEVKKGTKAEQSIDEDSGWSLYT